MFSRDFCAPGCSAGYDDVLRNAAWNEAVVARARRRHACRPPRESLHTDAVDQVFVFSPTHAAPMWLQTCQAIVALLHDSVEDGGGGAMRASAASPGRMSPRSLAIELGMSDGRLEALNRKVRLLSHQAYDSAPPTP